MEVSEVFEMTTRIAKEYTEGMPRPKADVSLTLGTGRWSGRTEEMIEVGSCHLCVSREPGIRH